MFLPPNWDYTNLFRPNSVIDEGSLTNIRILNSLRVARSRQACDFEAVTGLTM